MLIQPEWAQVQDLVARIPVGIVLVNFTGAVQVINPAARLLFPRLNHVNSAGIDSPAAGLFWPDGSPLSESDHPLVRALNQSETISNLELTLVDVQQNKMVLLVDAGPFYSATGERIGAMVVFQDITGRRQAEEKARAGDDRARLLASMSRSFAEIGNDYSLVVSAAARSVAEASGEACAIYLLSDEGAQLRMAASYHGGAQTQPEWHAFVENKQYVTQEEPEWAALRCETPILVPFSNNHHGSHPHLPDKLRALLAESQLVAPLRASGRALGILSLLRSDPSKLLTPEECEFIQDMADRAALAIENARLYSEEVQRNRELNALHDATKALLSTLDLEVLLGRILDAAQRALPAAERSVLYLMAPRTGRLEVRASMGFGDPRIRRMGLIQDSTADLAVREGRPLLIADALTEARNGGLFEEAVDTVRSAMVAPLLLGNEVLGALSLSSSRPAVFTHSDLRLLVSFAATTTAALHNAMLHAEMQKMAITDALTGLYNRRGLLELGGHEIDRFHRFESPLSAIMVDIDFFKKVNDSYGHPVGDQVLCGLAERTRMIIRLVDIFGRYGGEEFAIILPETDLFQAVSIAERVRVAIEEAPFQTSAGQITITASLGVTRAVRGLSGLTALLEQADAALYTAKMNGRNRVEIA
jgi:diguanylate cyclase (GGDEF)-like protein